RASSSLVLGSASCDSLHESRRNECIKPPRRHSSGNPSFNARLSRLDQAIDSATLQRRLVMETKRNGHPPVRSSRTQRVRAAPAPFQWTNPQAPERPGFMWFPVRTYSEPSSSAQSIRQAKRSDHDLPLKPCMKQKSKSAAATPPNGGSTDSEDSHGRRKLRRVKTVDFEGVLSKKLLSLPPLKLWTGQGDLEAGEPFERSKTAMEESSSNRAISVKRVRSCPGPKTKSTLADTAITRTDVHVVAIAPSWSSEEFPATDDDGIDLATPTMQIVESKTGCYEVVWDDVQKEPAIEAGGRCSSAGQALQAAGSFATKGLERVNTKLAEWSWGKDSLTRSYKPRIVVFPDDDGRNPQFGCAVEDDEDLVIIAPPNSERQSAIPSRHPSQPPSARMSRSVSHDDTEPDPAVNATDVSSDRQSLVVPDPEATNSRAGLLIGASRGTRKPSSIRRFSNMEDSDLKFRGHRDSVTLARSRILNAGGVSPELFMHRDSISMAKKRMHAKNHASSSAREIPHLNHVASDPPSPIADLSMSSSSAPTRKNTAEGLKTKDSASMLVRQDASLNRHIRIIE
ncbi:uncharacterized protein BDR25DRAFT_129036, partial [Lindgomyces ingoldianus]